MKKRNGGIIIWVLTIISVGILPMSEALAINILVQPYITWVTKTSVTIMWETDVPATSEVQYGITSGYGQDVVDSNMKTIHKVIVSGLSAESKRHYRVVSTITEPVYKVVQSTDYTFQTAVSDTSAFSFAFIGDTRRDSGSPIPLYTEDVANAIYNEHPDLVFNTGDVTMGTDVLTREETEQEYRVELFGTSAQLMAEVPYFVGIGDHERRGAAGDEVFSQYFSGYESPYWQHTYYTFVYGNARFIVLDSIITSDHADGVEVPGVGVGTDQYNWLVNVLQNASEKWKFIAYHYGTYQSDPRFDARDQEMRAIIGPLCDEYEIDMVLAGHAHFYERSYPITAGIRNDTIGTSYITAGTGGASLSPDPLGSELSAFHFSDWAYCLVEIDENILVMNVYDLGHDLRDSLTIAKYPTDKRLLVHYNLDEASGITANDASGNGHTGTFAVGSGGYSPPVIWDSVSKPSLSVANVSSARLTDNVNTLTTPDTSDLDGLKSFTLMMWVDGNPYNDFSSPAMTWKHSRPGGGHAGFTAWWDLSGMLYLVVGGESSNPVTVGASDSAGSLTGWHHWAITYDGTNMATNDTHFYLDGQLIGSAALHQSTVLANDIDLHVSCRGDVSYSQRHLFDEFRMYGSATDSSGALSQEDIQKIMVLAPTQCGMPGTVYWDMDFNKDCEVNLQDFSIFVLDWLKCTDPARPDCE